MGVVHSMDDAQVQRVSNALEGSANAIKGINIKFDDIDQHWRAVQEFNEGMNDKVQTTMDSMRRLDEVFNHRLDNALNMVIGAADELTMVLESTLMSIQKFNIRREMNQLPKAIIPLVVPLIILLIELAIANAYLGILLASLPEVRTKYSSYLFANASSVLLGLTLSLMWLVAYRLLLSYKTRRLQDWVVTKPMKATNPSEGDDERTSDTECKEPELQGGSTNTSRERLSSSTTDSEVVGEQATSSTSRNGAFMRRSRATTRSPLKENAVPFGRSATDFTRFTTERSMAMDRTVSEWAYRSNPLTTMELVTFQRRLADEIQRREAESPQQQNAHPAEGTFKQASEDLKQQFRESPWDGPIGEERSSSRPSACSGESDMDPRLRYGTASMDSEPPPATDTSRSFASALPGFPRQQISPSSGGAHGKAGGGGGAAAKAAAALPGSAHPQISPSSGGADGKAGDGGAAAARAAAAVATASTMGDDGSPRSGGSASAGRCGGRDTARRESPSSVSSDWRWRNPLKMQLTWHGRSPRTGQASSSCSSSWGTNVLPGGDGSSASGARSEPARLAAAADPEQQTLPGGGGGRLCRIVDDEAPLGVVADTQPPTATDSGPAPGGDPVRQRRV